MATLIENIKRIEKDKEDIRAAANGKGINISEEASLDEYADAISKINEDVTANNMNMLKDVVAIGSNGEKWVGEIEERGSLSARSRISVYEKNQPVNTGGQQTFPAGYYTNITLPDISLKLENYTEATATSGNILEGKTAYINGEKVHGSMPYNMSISFDLLAGDSYTIPEGYHEGYGVIGTLSLADQTLGDAMAEDIRKDKIAWVNGQEITGAMSTDVIIKEYSFAFSGTDYTIIFSDVENYTLVNAFAKTTQITMSSAGTVDLKFLVDINNKTFTFYGDDNNIITGAAGKVYAVYQPI